MRNRTGLETMIPVTSAGGEQSGVSAKENASWLTPDLVHSALEDPPAIGVFNDHTRAEALKQLDTFCAG